MKQAPLKVIIFDFDGVMADSHAFHAYALGQAAKHLNLPFSSKDHEQFFVGKSLIQGTEEYLDYYSQSENFDQFINLKKSFDSKYSKIIQPITGVLPFISQFEVNFPLAICSGARRILVDQFLNKYSLNHRFEVIVTVDDVAKSKPDPESYHLVLEQLQLPANQVIAIEDSPPGIESATAAGIATLGITTTHESSDLKKAAWTVDSFKAIFELLHRQGLV